MTTDWRALCAELVKELDDLRESSEGVAGFHRNGDLAPWSELGESGEFPWLSSFDRARAVLAEPDGPAVPEGREPASVATQPSDEEIEEWADACPEAPLEEMDPEVHGWRRCFTAKEFSETIRAALSRWGRPAAAPVPVSERLPRVVVIPLPAPEGGEVNK